MKNYCIFSLVLLWWPMDHNLFVVLKKRDIFLSSVETKFYVNFESFQIRSSLSRSRCNKHAKFQISSFFKREMMASPVKVSITKTRGLK